MVARTRRDSPCRSIRLPRCLTQHNLSSRSSAEIRTKILETITMTTALCLYRNSHSSTGPILDHTVVPLVASLMSSHNISIDLIVEEAEEVVAVDVVVERQMTCAL